MSAMRVPEGKYADVGDGLRIHYHDQGTGPVVLFLHGSGPGASGWSNFKRNFPFFAEHGFRCIVPDTLGYGYSSKPEDREYTLDFLVSKVSALLDSLGVSRCAVVGNSHGGAMATQLALDRPELVTKLVVMGPGGLEDRERYMQMEGIRSMVKAFFGGITRESMRKVFELQLWDPSLVSDELIEERTQIAELQPKRVLSSMVVPNLAPRLGELRCPVFALWGVEDRFCPASGAMKIAESVPDARVMLLSKCGHWVMVEHEALFNRLGVDFLREP
jgi:4,5:9,10-diseco-3-hydroxy-5,9,17-trioxoandrosta-1(10),2-diene-4-oate hydrolase